MFTSYYDWLWMTVDTSYTLVFGWVFGVALFIGFVMAGLALVLDWEEGSAGAAVGLGFGLGLVGGLLWPALMMLLPFILIAGLAAGIGYVIGIVVKGSRIRKERAETFRKTGYWGESEGGRR